MIRSLLSLYLLLSSVLLYSQKTIHYADSIRVIYNIPELSYAVVDATTTLEIAALGKHSVSLPDVATVQDRFHLGSNTKAMTAFVIAKYIEKGNLQWKTPFFSLFPEWRTKSNPAYANITLQDLLSHRARIQPFQGENDPEIPPFKGSNAEKRKQFSQFVLTVQPVTLDEQNPFVYSNAGYTLATLMVEKVTGKTWEQLVEKVFNKDLKLHIGFSWPDNLNRKDTWGHSTENDELTPVPSNNDYHLDYTEPAGDLNSTLPNYIKFIQLNLQGLEGKNNYLKANTYHFLHKGMGHYAIGWFNIYENGKELSVHSGTGAFTYFTLVHIDRITKKAYIVFTNSFNDNTQQGVRLIMRRLKQNYGS